MAMIGDVKFNVLSESRSYSNDLTSHKVEDGVDITDHVKNNPISYSVEGAVGDEDDPGAVHSKLIKMWSAGDTVKYVGRSMMSRCIIHDLSTNVDSSTISSFTFSMTITEIRTARPSTVSLLPIALKVDVADIGNAGRVQMQ